MHRTIAVVAGILLAATTTFAQSPPPGQVGLAAYLQMLYGRYKENLVQAAEKMPDSDYSFKPTPEIRTYGGQLGHAANFHYLGCAALKGQANPIQGQNLEQKTTKAEFVKALRDSFAYCDSLFSALSDESALQMVPPSSAVTVPIARAGVLTNLLTHDNEVYGILTVYLRLKGLVPPSTENEARARGAQGHGEGSPSSEGRGRGRER
jgi:uncharacterized damage-inducible protein DinB